MRKADAVKKGGEIQKSEGGVPSLAPAELPGHTPTPWYVGFEDGSGMSDEDGWCICAIDYEVDTGKNGCVVMSGDCDGASMGIRTEADARHIVHCVNLHSQLVEALQALVDVCRHSSYPDEFAMAEAVLQKAREDA